MAIDDVKAYDPKKRVWVTGEEEERTITLPKMMPTALSYLSAGKQPYRVAIGLHLCLFVGLTGFS